MKTKASLEQLNAIGLVAAKMVQPGQRVGLGSGRAALAFVRALARRVREEKLEIVGVPSSIATEQVARDGGIPLGTLVEIEELDITVDGADEVDPALNMIKGGGGYLTREKVVASITKKFVIVVGGEKLVPQLGHTFPVFLEVLEFARHVVTRKLEAMGVTVTLRKNADGSLYVTDNGNSYLEARFPRGALADPGAVDLKLDAMPGVIETGLFIGRADEVIVAHGDGRVEHLRRK